MSKKIFVLFIFALLLPGLLYAGTTGKIKGKVIDKESGEPLPGANVSIENTSMGAATNIDGEYFILNVPAGVYTLKGNFMGYSEVKIANIKVVTDLTTEVNFELLLEALAGETVTIVAERPLVNKNATNAMRVQSYEEFKNIPLRNTMAIVALQPGVVVQDEVMYVRGGRNDEVGFYLEGAVTRDAFNGTNAAKVIPDALEEINLQAGGYTAEYGGANAGIIRQTLRSGTPDYHFSIQGETDNFADPGDQLLDTYSYGYSDYTMTASGPVPFTNNKLKFFFAGENIYQEDRIVRFWDGFDFYHESDPTKMDDTHFPIVNTDHADTDSFPSLHMYDGRVPFAHQKEWLGAGTLVWDQNPFQLRLGTNLYWTNFQTVDDMCNYENILNSGRIEQNDQSQTMLNLKFTHVLNPTTFYEVNFNYFDFRNKVYDPILGDNFVAYYDSITNAEHGVTFLDWQGGTVGNELDIYGFDFDEIGNPSNYQKDKRNYWGGSLSLITQFGSHELRIGGDFQLWTLRRFLLAGDTHGAQNPGEKSLFTNMITNPDQWRDAVNGDQQAQGFVRTGANITNFGYDIFGNEIDEDQLGTDGPKHPKYGSAYIQDKYEVEQLVINMGVRLDYIDNDDFTFEDPMNPTWNQDANCLYADSVTKKDAFIAASPRIGLAFPATDRAVFHIQYGKFIQAPQLSDIYGGDRFYNDLFTAGNYFSTPTGFGLDPQKTTSYEAGFNYQFTDNASFDITVFYKDIQDYITAGKLVGETTDLLTSYNVLVNGDFATTKGLEFSMTLRRTNRVAAQLNYTYSSALGTGSDPLSAIAATENSEPTPTIISPLDYHRPHVGSLNFDYRFGKDDGGTIFEQMGLNLLLNFASGHPYTLREGAFGQQDASLGGMMSDTRNRSPLEAINSSITPSTWDINLRLDKTVNFGKFAANFYLYVQNLTNRRNAANVYQRTGNPYDDGFRAMEISGTTANANGGDRYWALFDAINGPNGWNYTNAMNASGQRFILNTMLFGTPRQIRVGVKLEM